MTRKSVATLWERSAHTAGLALRAQRITNQIARREKERDEDGSSIP